MAYGRVSALAVIAVCMAMIPLQAERESVSVTADHLHYDYATRTLTAEKHVVVRLRGVELNGDKLAMDLDTELGSIHGNVTVTARAQTITGDFVNFNLRTGEWDTSASKIVISPSFFEQGVVAPLYASGGKITGEPNDIRITNGRATSCDLSSPHYSLDAERIDIIPNKELLARKVKLKVLGTTIATLPSFRISLEPTAGRNQIPIVPRFGRNDVEGYFLKTAYNYRATLSHINTLYVDLMQKRGLGLGLENQYAYPKGDGDIYIYNLKDRNTGATELDARLKHRQQLSDTVTSNLNLDYTRNNSFFTGTASLNSDLTFNRRTGDSSSSLAIRRQDYSGLSTSTNSTVGLQHQQQFSSVFSGTFSSDFRTTSTGPGQHADEELNNRVELTRRGKRFDTLMRFEDRVDLDGNKYTGDNFYSAFEKLPEFVLRSNSSQLGFKTLGLFDTNFETSWGWYRELPSDISLQRGYFGMDLSPYTKQLSTHNSLLVGGRFQQTYYSDNTAQYVIEYNADMETTFGNGWRSSLNYDKQRPAGYTPFRTDFASPYESLDYRIIQSARTTQANISAGYDFTTNQYRDIIGRFQFRPNKSQYYSLSTGYSIENSQFRDFIGRINYTTGPKNLFDLNLTPRYSPQLGKLSRINTYLNWRITPKWRLEALSGYNGFTSQFDFNQIKLTRDLHCWEAFLTYDQQRREVRLDFAIKAFPAFDTRFGYGQTGQLLDTSGGEIY